MDHLIFQCNKLSNQTNEMIKQIKTLVALGLRRMKR
jgi:ribosomal protein L30/L7E